MMITTTKFKNMKTHFMKWLTIGMFTILGVNTIDAQSEVDDELDPRRKEKIEVLKRSFITDKIQLTVAEAEKFWPLYNERENNQESIRRAIKERMAESKRNPGNERDVLAGIDFVTSKRKEEADNDAKFLKAVMPIIGSERCVKLAAADRDFQRELIRKMKEGRGEGGQGGKRRPNQK